MRNKIRILAVLFLLSFSIYLEVYSQNNPIIFIHGNKSEATDTAGYKTFYPTDSQGDLVYSTAMTRILAGGYKGYKIGLKSNGTPAVKCNENTILKQMYNSKYIYNFSYYHPDGSPGAIGSNGNLTLQHIWF